VEIRRRTLVGSRCRRSGGGPVTDAPGARARNELKELHLAFHLLRPGARAGPLGLSRGRVAPAAGGFYVPQLHDPTWQVVGIYRDSGQPVSPRYHGGHCSSSTRFSSSPYLVSQAGRIARARSPERPDGRSRSDGSDQDGAPCLRALTSSGF
jgi:hypothetical protein